ncbi:enoyl-CoA hydratase/isomerase family protein [Novispirillum sp. DQ9]|uniref:enoyl-CoA hydratase/isomerase family protein n=1 Tax=Novispirillum sp. DQ9 TaxID=3398612 RepID=UPI003C7AD851
MDPATLTSPLGARLRLLLLDSPPVNSLGHALRRRLVEAVDAAEADPACAGIVIAGAGKLFCAGADAREFGTPASTSPPDLRQVLARLLACRKPVIAAIHGAALGGGLELAMACHYRVAASEARLGLPEVNLGLIPGAWGTQMLPRLTGMDFAVEMIARGRVISAGTAADVGLVDAVAPPGMIPEAAAAGFFDAVAERSQHPDVRHRSVRSPEAVEDWLAAHDSRLRAEFPGQPAPVAAVRAIALAATLPFEEAVRRERQAFVDLMASPESAALRHIFFAERDSARVPDAKVRPCDAPVAVVEKPGTADVARLLADALGPAGDGALRLDLLEPITVSVTGTTVVPARLRAEGGASSGLALAVRVGRVTCVEVSSTDVAGVAAALGLAERLGASAVCTPAPAGDTVLAAVAASLQDAPTRASAEERISRTLAKLLAAGCFHRPADGDVLAVHAFSYPRHRGGPLYQAGLPKHQPGAPRP